MFCGNQWIIHYMSKGKYWIDSAPKALWLSINDDSSLYFFPLFFHAFLFIRIVRMCFFSIMVRIPWYLFPSMYPSHPFYHIASFAFVDWKCVSISFWSVKFLPAVHKNMHRTCQSYTTTVANNIDKWMMGLL